MADIQGADGWAGRVRGSMSTEAIKSHIEAMFADEGPQPPPADLSKKPRKGAPATPL